MDIGIPSPPVSASLLPLAVWLLGAALPLVKLRSQGWAKTRRYGLWMLLGLAPLTLPSLYFVRVNEVEVRDGRIQVQAGFFYKQDRPIADFDLDAAAAGAWRDLPQARMSARLNGIGTYGYNAGHYSLSSGGLAFLMVSDAERTLFLPARTGPALLVSVNHPQGLLDLLRRQGGTN